MLPLLLVVAWCWWTIQYTRRRILGVDDDDDAVVVGATSLLSMNNDGSARPVNDNANVGVMVHVMLGPDVRYTCQLSCIFPDRLEVY